MAFAIKCEGGPVPGTRMTDDLEDYGLSWPLPDVLPGTEDYGGHYAKVSESQLPVEAAKNPHLALTAVYVWKENE